MGENVQCNTWKHDYPKISRDAGKKTLHKWVWTAKGPGTVASNFPVLTLDNATFRWSLLDSHHNLSIAGKFLKTASKIWTEGMSLVPKQAAQIWEPLASFPEWNWDRKEAGSNNHSRKHSPQLRQGWARSAAGSQHAPERLPPKSCNSGPGGCACYPALPPGSLASFLSSCLEENFCLLQPFPLCSSTDLCAGTNICSI